MKKFLALLAALLCLVPTIRADERLKPFDNGYTYVTFGNYPYYENGDTKPILWRVLSNENGLLYLFSEYILDVRKVHEDWTKYKGWLSSDGYKWLNEEFIKNAFTDDEIKALYPHEEGTVSLISSDEIKNKAFGFMQNKDRFSYGTPYAYLQGPAGLYVYSGSKSSPIWTRTPSNKKHAQRTTKIDGSIGYAAVSWKDIGMRPVIWLMLDSVEISEGEGTKDIPYVLKLK